jgi:hypothetical protein
MTDKTQEFKDLEEELTTGVRTRLRAEAIQETYDELPAVEQEPIQEAAKDLIVELKEDVPGLAVGPKTALEIIGALGIWLAENPEPVPQGFLHDADFSDEPVPEKITVVPEGEVLHG